MIYTVVFEKSLIMNMEADKKFTKLGIEKEMYLLKKESGFSLFRCVLPISGSGKNHKKKAIAHTS